MVCDPLGQASLPPRRRLSAVCQGGGRVSPAEVPSSLAEVPSSPAEVPSSPAEVPSSPAGDLHLAARLCATLTQAFEKGLQHLTGAHRPSLSRAELLLSCHLPHGFAARTQQS